MAGCVTEAKLKELAKKYKLCKDVPIDDCITINNHNCHNCMYCITEDGWGGGEAQDVCTAYKITQEV